MALLERHSKVTVVFISRCVSAEDTTQYFDKMPYWTAMPHEAAAGQRGAGLFKNFELTTVPALVLLEGKGNVICWDARTHFIADPTGIIFPWATKAEPPARSPTVKFARESLRAPRATLVPPLSLPPAPLKQSGASLSLQSPDRGLPPRFTGNGLATTWHDRVTVDKEVTDGKLRGGKVLMAQASPRRVAAVLDNRPQVPAGVHARARSRRVAKCKDPPDIVGPGRSPPKPNRVATRSMPAICPSAMKKDAENKRNQYDWSCVPECLRRHKPESIPQGEQKLLMQPQPLADVHPFTPTLKKWRHGIPVDCGPDLDWDVITAAV
jgi:hypothetical protein